MTFASITNDGTDSVRLSESIIPAYAFVVGHPRTVGAERHLDRVEVERESREIHFVVERPLEKAHALEPPNSRVNEHEYTVNLRELDSLFDPLVSW